MGVEKDSLINLGAPNSFDPFCPLESVFSIYRVRATLVEIRHPRENKALSVLVSKEDVAEDVACVILIQLHLKDEGFLNNQTLDSF